MFKQNMALELRDKKAQKHLILIWHKAEWKPHAGQTEWALIPITIVTSLLSNSFLSGLPVYPDRSYPLYPLQMLNMNSLADYVF